MCLLGSMKTLTSWLGAFAVISGSCLLWISGTTLALVHLLELSASAGWVIAACLGTTAIVATLAVIYEMVHAIDLTETPVPAGQKFDAWALPYLRGREFASGG